MGGPRAGVRSMLFAACCALAGCDVLAHAHDASERAGLTPLDRSPTLETLRREARDPEQPTPHYRTRVRIALVPALASEWPRAKDPAAVDAEAESAYQLAMSLATDDDLADRMREAMAS